MTNTLFLEAKKYVHIFRVVFKNWKPLETEILFHLSPPKKEQLHKRRVCLHYVVRCVHPSCPVQSRGIIPALSYANQENSLWVSRLLDQIFTLTTSTKYLILLLNDRYSGNLLLYSHWKFLLGFFSRWDEGIWDKITFR